ncbi:DUF2510 domain-containing protein [Rhodococcus sp. ARC_M6]
MSNRSRQSRNAPRNYGAVAPGWYPDAGDPRFVRWHDGQTWTDQVTPR